MGIGTLLRDLEVSNHNHSNWLSHSINNNKKTLHFHWLLLIADYNNACGTVRTVQLRWQIVWGVYCLEVSTARRGRTDVTPHAGVRDQQPPGQGLRGAATGAHPDIPVDILHAKVKDMTCLGSGVVTGRKTHSRVPRAVTMWHPMRECGSTSGCSLRCTVNV